jgi:hypothetical protein
MIYFAKIKNITSKIQHVFWKVALQGDFESCADILITSYWLHVELGKNI